MQTGSVKRIKRAKRKISSLVLSAALLLSAFSFLTGCHSPALSKYTASSFEFFDTVTTVTGYAESRETFDTVSRDVFELLRHYHRLYDIYTVYPELNNLCALNSLVDGEHPELSVDEEIVALLRYGTELCAQTDGAMNIALGSVLSLWHTQREKALADPSGAALPSEEELKKAAQHCSVDDIAIDFEKNTVQLTDPELRLDVGALAKGYAVERVAQALETQGIAGYLLNVGGTVRAVGSTPDGNGFRVGVEDPAALEGDVSADPYLAVLSLRSAAVVTSGDYQRYYTVDGVRYHHIIDAKTLYPATLYRSVTVVCRDAGLGDALSTALFQLSVEEGKELLQKYPGTEALWLCEDGRLLQTDGFAECTK